MNRYECFYRGKRTSVRADTTREAQRKAAAFFKAKKDYEVHVVLAYLGDDPVAISPSTL
jgi:hypothetical protein